MLRSGLIADVAVVAAVTVEVDVEGRLKSTMVSVSFPCSDLTGTDEASTGLAIAEDNTGGEGMWDCTGITE